ncbi:MAG: hypothetical protein GVY17_01145 [Cyanobacteria bacterium]|nr:hypothetical protein [Cyanobacteria bacterium GSL.Bin21]
MFLGSGRRSSLLQPNSNIQNGAIAFIPLLSVSEQKNQFNFLKPFLIARCASGAGEAIALWVQMLCFRI